MSAHINSNSCSILFSAGRVTITQTQSTKTGFSSSATVKELARLGPGQSFGELALMEDAPRKATVTASSDTVQVHTHRSFFKIVIPISYISCANIICNGSVGLLTGKASYTYSVVSKKLKMKT